MFFTCLFVHDHVDLDSCFCSPFEDLINPVLLVEVWWTTEEEFG